MVQTRFFTFLVMFILMPSCKIDRKNSVDRDKFTFRITDDSFLFFKNVRQIYYDLQDLPQAHWYAYRYSDRPVSLDKPVITPVIVVDWIRNEGYLHVEANEVLQDEAELVIREKGNHGQVYEYRLGERGRENMLEFATKIYEGIMAENDILIKLSDQYVPLFSNDEDRDSFRVVMGDYYRLTHVF